MPEPLFRPAELRTQVRIPVRTERDFCTTATVFSFHGLVDGQEHLAIALGDRHRTTPLVRVHSECLTDDVLGSARCDCGPQLAESIERITQRGGYLLYLRQEGRGIGLYAKLDAYALQDRGLDTYQANRALGHPADARDYTVAAQMLDALGVNRIELLSSNPDKAAQLRRLGIEVAYEVPTRTHWTPANARYLAAKVDITGHALTVPRDDGPGTAVVGGRSDTFDHGIRRDSGEPAA